MKKIIVLALLTLAGTAHSETLTVKYCPSEADTPNSIKAKLSRKATDELKVIGFRYKQALLEMHDEDSLEVDTRVLGEPPIITSVSYDVDGDCNLGIYTY
ncbi:hypothetical protein H5185_12120 [Shewanella sp. SG44-6]|jgi:hypothetical protein|uniref:hypothetical protein n=1 Tax=Shewanella sp. SG44-6 TaxID=2760959 RepID=UPI0016023A88|nr:hypothetical protein [Shewanella sp. SG44-6]MBB1390159.1 hypothetical protein [Shewanella sp. SG44-6]